MAQPLSELERLQLHCAVLEKLLLYYMTPREVSLMHSINGEDKAIERNRIIHQFRPRAIAELDGLHQLHEHLRIAS